MSTGNSSDLTCYQSFCQSLAAFSPAATRMQYRETTPNSARSEYRATALRLRRIQFYVPKKLETSAADFLPQRRTLPVLRDASKKCRGCELWTKGTQTVFGEGGAHAQVMFVGEQPGDKEDLSGKPFVGPAGALLDKALVAAGIDRTQVYVTNAVKHFNWEPRGKRRIHKKPNAMHIAACRPWLDSEIAAIKPRVIVCLGATAAQALLGRTFKVTQRRGDLIAFSLAPYIVATVHPSSILRAPDDDSRHAEMARFIDDLRVVASAMKEKKAA